MKLDDVQLAIRPRTILECLDVSFLFCGRHFFGLFVAASIGILPFASLNWWLADIPTMDGYAAYLLLSMEMPWATSLITFFLGQAVFSRKFSVRRMIRDGLQAVPSMLLFQVLVRGLCLMMVILAPIVFFGMYFLNEIILLEKPPISKTWNRRTAMNARMMTRIITLRIADFCILSGGTFALSNLFRAISSLWDDRIDEIREMLSDPDLMTVMTDWQLQAAFWVTVVFLTVFRFVVYLDSRIKREGWDVELKLRAQAEFHRQREVTA